MQVINALIVELLNVLFTNLATWLTEPLLHWNVVMFFFGSMLIGVLRISRTFFDGFMKFMTKPFTFWKIRLFEMTKILVDVWFWAGLTRLFSRIERIIGPTQSMPITSWSLAQRGPTGGCQLDGLHQCRSVAAWDTSVCQMATLPGQNGGVQIHQLLLLPVLHCLPQGEGFPLKMCVRGENWRFNFLRCASNSESQIHRVLFLLIGTSLASSMDTAVPVWMIL